MRWVHLLGLGFVVGLTALGFAVSVALFRWNEIAYPPQASSAAVQPAAQKESATIPPDAAQGQTVFQQKCASCHKIGGGKLVGPDLKGVTQNRQRDWLVKFITVPDQVIASGDPTAQQLVKEYGAPMPNVGVTADQANQLLAYIDFQSGTSTLAAGAQPTGGPASQGAAPTQAPAGAPPAGGAPAGDPNKGKSTFEQKCSTCHNIGGGRKVGPDLKGVTAQQSHDWLVNMITQPDKWTSSDPTAQGLLKEYGVQMPNLAISPGDANDLIAYIQQQSGGAAAPPVRNVPLGLQPAGGGIRPLVAIAPAVAVLSGLDTLNSPLFQQPAGNPGQGKSVFDQKCASCHSIGGGKLVGPDLKGVTGQRPHDWLISFITTPDKVIASGDATAKQLVSEYGMPMPNVGVSQPQAEDILAYIQQQSGGAAAPPGGAPQAVQIQPGNAQNGRALFAGEKRLSGGGPPCIACHTAAGVAALGGGAVGLDLTKEQTKLGTAGIASTLKAPSFPTMKEAYEGHAMTDSEIADLAGFFVEEDRQQPSANDWVLFPVAGLVAFAIMAAIAAIPWLGRTRNVRQTLVRGAGR